MKIPDSHLNGLSGAGVGGPERARGADPNSANQGVRGANSSGESDHVQLSNLSLGVRVNSEDSPERLQKVDQLRADYQAGRYQPDAQEVSKSIIQDALQEPRPTQGPS